MDRLPNDIKEAIGPQREVSHRLLTVIDEMRAEGIKDDLILSALVGLTNSIHNRRVIEHERESYAD